MRRLSWRMTVTMPALALALILSPRVGNSAGASAHAASPNASGPPRPPSVQVKPPSHRSLRQGMFDLSKIDFASVVMLGDSLTERAQWSEITGCHFVANRGIGGDQSSHLLKRLDDVVKLKPAAVFLMVGVNDIITSVPIDTILDNVERMIVRLKQNGSRVYLTLVLPVAHSFSRKINPKVDELNAAYVKLAGRLDVPLVDFTAKTRTSDGALRDELSLDGIHLKTEGYRLWRDAIAPLVAQHCPPRPAPVPARKPVKR
jgi:lysophospholipase L1-like esterase